MIEEESGGDTPRRGPLAGRGKVVGAVAVGALLVAAAVGIIVTRDRAPERPVADGPNIVVIMTDDQTLRSMEVMPNTRRLIGDQGTTFTNALVSFPNCCPSRATYLTGQYAHNHGVRDNVKPFGGASALEPDETLPVWLQDAGYQTVHVGKYLNGWGQGGDIAPEPGWDRWFSLIDPTTYRYYDYEVSVDGERRRYGDADGDYSTDVLAAEAIAQIHERAGGDRPFFLSFTPLAPHVAMAEREAGTAGSGARRFGKPVAPRRHVTDYVGRGLDYGAAVDQADVSDLPEGLRRDPLTPQSKDYLALYEVGELGALAAVDEAVSDIVKALTEEGVLNDTVVLFTSDNGLFHGEHRIVTGKFLLYDPAVRVPLLIRGQGFEKGATVNTPVINADLAPTILDIAGAEAGLPGDGTDVAKVAARGGDRAVLLENFSKGEQATAGVRTRRWSYLEHASGEKELYDVIADPDQVDNLYGSEESFEVALLLGDLLDELKDCAAASCSVPVPPELAAD